MSNPAKPTNPPQKTVNLALQGGGAHGAFTWGVLDRLLEDDRLEFEGITATSSGAVNAVVLADGLAEGGHDGARDALQRYWKKVSDLSSRGIFVPSLIDKANPEFGLEHSPGFMFVEPMTYFASPYQMNPFNFNPIKDLLAAGYNVLTWDPRGFGKSGGTAEVDSVRYEAKDVSTLVSWVAEQPGVLLDAPGDPLFVGRPFRFGFSERSSRSIAAREATFIWSTLPAPTGAPSCRRASSRTIAFAVSTTGGVTMRAGSAWSNRVKTPGLPARCAFAPTRSTSTSVSFSPISARKIRRPRCAAFRISRAPACWKPIRRKSGRAIFSIGSTTTWLTFRGRTASRSNASGNASSTTRTRKPTRKPRSASPTRTASAIRT